MQYFQNFPKVLYSFDPNLKDAFLVTNIFTRVQFLTDYLQNLNIFYTYNMQDHDTFESIAEKYYGDANRYWIILLANQIINPAYQAPLNDLEFINYLTNKYGSVVVAQSTIDHYEKVTVTTAKPAGQPSSITTSKLYYSNTTYSIVDEVSNQTITNLPTLAHPTLQLTSPQSVNLDGTTYSTVITLNAVSSYDAEFSENQSKRVIQLPKKEYAAQIETQLKSLLTSTL
jgi:Base plate wedge protein 53